MLAFFLPPPLSSYITLGWLHLTYYAVFSLLIFQKCFVVACRLYT